MQINEREFAKVFKKFSVHYVLVGMTTYATYALASVAALIQVVAAAWVGGMLYTESGTA